MATLAPANALRIDSVPEGARSVPEAVHKQAELRPHAIAVTAGAQVITYGELELQADALARRLISAGVGENVPVGLCMPRSIEMVVGALGILKSGAAYIPMDPGYPLDRLAFTLRDAGAPVLVTDALHVSQFAGLPCEAVTVDVTDKSEEEGFGLPVIPPSNLAYIVYTSGSTGTPKGVEITHASLWNLVAWHCRAFEVSTHDRASHVAGLSFDAAVWELWPYLASGASLHLADDMTRQSPELLRDWLLERAITIGFAPTPIAERLITLQWPPRTPLRLLLTGGEMLRRWPPADLPFRLVNNYGPSECTVVATSGVVPADGAAGGLPPIGSAIDGLYVYMLDERMRPVFPGNPGEIYIGGAGVARGYRNQPELTAARFIRDPFQDDPEARLYRTGDLAQFLPDGRIEFLGRADDQIKIRGYRIEPNEIVAALGRHPDVRQSLVVAREDTPGDKRLIAYLVLDSAGTATASQLRDVLRRALPEYMVPAAFVVLESLPLTPHGKIDRSALPAPHPKNSLADSLALEQPATELERRIGQIASALLGLPSIGLHDNFFLMGGHSLLGAQLISNLRKTFGVEICLRALFANPTVAGLAEEIGRLSGSEPACTDRCAQTREDLA